MVMTTKRSPIWANLRFVRALTATSFKASAAMRGNFWLQAVFMLINNLAFFMIWWLLFQRVGSIRGWKISDVELLYGQTTASYGLMQVFAGGVRHISRWIDEGELDSLLVQPKRTWLYAVGSRSQASGFGDVLTGLLFWAASGRVHLDNAVLALVCMLCGATTFLGCALAFYSVAFWLRRTETLSRQLLEFLVLFSLYPEVLFGGALRGLLFSVLPAGFVAYLPVHVLRDGNLVALGCVVLGACGFLALGVAIFQRGLRRYASGSRFGVWG
jgi:ABC-2 type transport system permease protein